MSVAINYNILKLTILSILLLSVFGQSHKDKTDDLCPRIINVLCVRDILAKISDAAKGIKNIAQQIEQHILKQQSNQDILNKYINQKITEIQSNFPKSVYHYQLMEKNNINKTDLINLMQEEYYAYSYLYNSIKNILKMQNVFGKTFDKSFKKILKIIQTNIICNYRNILHVYSETWLTIDEIHGIQISKRHKRNTAPSVLHNIYSIIVIRLLNEWGNHNQNFLINIERRLI